MAEQAQAVTFSFETPLQGNGGYQYGPLTDAGVTYNNRAGVAAPGSAFLGGTTPADGRQVAFIQSTDGIEGMVSLALSGLTSGTS